MDTELTIDQLIQAATEMGELSMKELVITKQIESKEMLIEFIKCKKDPLYFMERYMTIDGKPIHLRQHQKEFAETWMKVKPKPWWTNCDTHGTRWWGPEFPMPGLCDNPNCKYCRVEEIARDQMANMELEFTERLLFGETMSVHRYQKDALRTESNDFDAIRERLHDEKVLRLLHVGIGMATEAGEILDALKKHVFYGKELDEVNLVEEIGDSQWYAAIGADALDISLDSIQKININKLKKRFPNKFTEEDAENRDLDKERKTLEDGKNSKK